MKKSLHTLQQSAIESAMLRGHCLNAFRRITPHTSRARCKHCGMEVDINEKPAPNQTGIAGEAVALNCKA